MNNLMKFLENEGQAPIKGERKYLPPFYPGYAVGSNIIQLTGHSQSGKTVSALYADAVPEGELPNTLYLDLEYSVPIADGVGVHLVNALPKYAGTLSSPDIYQPYFLAFMEFLETVKAGEWDDYRTLVIDPIDGLHIGANVWVRANEEKFARYKKAFSGKQGAIFSWGPTNDLWREIMMMLLGHFENIILISHIGAKYKNDVEVGQKSRGAKFDEITSLSLWLHRPGWDEPGIPKNAWGVEVRKGRFQKPVKPSLEILKKEGVIEALIQNGSISPDEVESLNENDPRLLPFMTPRPMRLLPAKFFVKPGETLFSVLRRLMLTPSENWGELESVENPGVKLKMDEEERLRLEAFRTSNELALQELKMQEKLQAAKRSMANRLKRAGYKDNQEIAEAVRELGVTITLDNISEVEEKLLERLKK